MDFNSHYKHFITLNKKSNSAVSIVAGLNSADDFGRLDEEGYKTREIKEVEYKDTEKEIDAIFEIFKTQYPAEFAAQLALINQKLLLVKNYLSSQNSDDKFDLFLTERLLKEFDDILNNRPTRAVRCWAYAVSDNIIIRYEKNI